MSIKSTFWEYGYTGYTWYVDVGNPQTEGDGCEENERDVFDINVWENLLGSPAYNNNTQSAWWQNNEVEIKNRIYEDLIFAYSYHSREIFFSRKQFLAKLYLNKECFTATNDMQCHLMTVFH